MSQREARAKGMKTRRHLTPAFRVWWGPDALRQLATDLERAGLGRAVVFCGRTLADHPDGLAAIREALGVRYAGVFDAVKAHSPLAAVAGGARTLRDLGADCVVALGGGSAVVTARASSILLAEGRDITELCTRFAEGQPPVSPRLDQPKLPQFVVPSTPTTAYAKAGCAVSDEEGGRRLALFDPKVRPTALYIDPSVAVTAPPALARAAGVNALCLAVQGIESRVRDPLADASLMHALRVLAPNLRRLASAPSDPDTRVELMLGALLAGEGTNYAPSGMTSAVAHCIGARFHLDNGIVNAILLPHVMRFNAGATRGRLDMVAQALAHAEAGASRSDAVAEVERLFAELGLPRRLRDVGVDQASLPLIAGASLADWFLHQNPRPVLGADVIVEVLEAAW